jgi:hypothetical protein
MNNKIRNIALGLGALASVGCGSYSTLIRNQKVTDIPSDQYERIIRLNNPDGSADDTLAGLIFIKKGAKICTDYPREETIKSLDELAMMEQSVYPYFSNYAIKAGDETLGFVSVPVYYRVFIWENKKDGDCRYKVQVMLIKKVGGGNGGGDGAAKPGTGGGGQ